MQKQIYGLGYLSHILFWNSLFFEVEIFCFFFFLLAAVSCILLNNSDMLNESFSFLLHIVLL